MPLCLRTTWLVCFLCLACKAYSSPDAPPYQIGADDSSMNNSPTKPLSIPIVTIAIIGGALLITGTILSIWYLHRRMSRRKQANYSHEKGADSLRTSSRPTVSSYYPSVPPSYQSSLASPSRTAADVSPLTSQSPFFTRPPSCTRDQLLVPKPLDPHRESPRKTRPNSSEISQGKSVGGIYELPASPRRIFISTARGNECRHTWDPDRTPRDSKNKMLPEIPGETRRWL